MGLYYRLVTCKTALKEEHNSSDSVSQESLETANKLRQIKLYISSLQFTVSKFL